VIFIHCIGKLLANYWQLLATVLEIIGKLLATVLEIIGKLLANELFFVYTL